MVRRSTLSPHNTPAPYRPKIRTFEAALDGDLFEREWQRSAFQVLVLVRTDPPLLSHRQARLTLVGGQAHTRPLRASLRQTAPLGEHRVCPEGVRRRSLSLLTPSRCGQDHSS